MAQLGPHKGKRIHAIELVLFQRSLQQPGVSYLKLLFRKFIYQLVYKTPKDIEGGLTRSAICHFSPSVAKDNEYHKSP